MENKWNKKNVLRSALYIVIYDVMSAIVCILGSIHPILFVCYQITAAILVTGVTVKYFDHTRTHGDALCLSAGMILLFFIIGDANLWHCVPIVVIGILAELIGLILGNEKWLAIVIKSIIMSFSTFGYYGQIWLNRKYTYDCAIDEMPTGYADTLMKLSPMWSLPVIMIISIAVSVIVAKVTARLFKLNMKGN